MNVWIERLLANRWFGWGLRILLSGVFIYAGAAKVGSPQSFADSIATFRLLPEALINPLALGLPLFEIAVGVFLLVNRWLRAAALGAMLMTSVFIIAIGSALIRGIRVDCGCFGGGHMDPAASNYLAFGRDLFLGAGATALFWWANHRTIGAFNRKEEHPRAR